MHTYAQYIHFINKVNAKCNKCVEKALDTKAESYKSQQQRQQIANKE